MRVRGPCVVRRGHVCERAMRVRVSRYAKVYATLGTGVLYW